MKCPTCKQKIEVTPKNMLKINKQNLVKAKKDFVKKLRGDGFTYRQIMEITGYSSTNSIRKIIKNND